MQEKGIEIVAVNPNQQSTTITWESIGVVTSVLVSISILIGLIIKATSNFNRIDSRLQSIQEDLISHIKTAGHEKNQVKLENLEKQLNHHDKSFYIHLEDYQNRKETVQFLIGQLDQKITHTREKGQSELKEAEDEIKELRHELKELQRWLQKHESFIIREAL